MDSTAPLPRNLNEPRSSLGSCYNADSDSEAGGRVDSMPLSGLSDAAAVAGLSTVLQEQRSEGGAQGAWWSGKSGVGGAGSIRAKWEHLRDADSQAPRQNC